MTWRQAIRRAVTTILAVLVTFVLAPVVSEFFIKLAEERGYYDQPSAKVASAMETLALITESWWFLVALGYVAGGASFMWIDYFLRRTERQRDETVLVKWVPTSIRLQFRAGTHSVIQLANQNVQQFNGERFNPRFLGQDGQLLGEQVLWYFFLIFKKPTAYGQIIIDAGNATIPGYRVIHQGHFGAIIQVQGDIGNIAVDIRCLQPNPTSGSHNQ